MDVSHILDQLNDNQRQAVTAPLSNVLVLAGAGSGKTRVLTHRIAWCIATENISPYAILAVTFTNKSAYEMRARVGSIVGQVAKGMWIGTFHGIAHRVLRAHWQEAQLLKDFQIIDSDDQYRMIRRLVRTLQLDEEQFPIREIQWFINTRKEEGLRVENIDSAHQHLIDVYEQYQILCQRSGIVDFAELMLRTYELFQQHPKVLEHYQNRFQKILVDEFQDTNQLQYALLNLLSSNQNSLFCVGDDDQSIYSWRGSKIEYINSFQRDFKDAMLIRLEQNYRSTDTILKAANALIAHNKSRLGKELWTEDSTGDKVKIYIAFKETDEARFVAEQIQLDIEQDTQYYQCAILYRVSAQSRVIEEALLQNNIPYRIYGGMRFYDRAEIKNALSYVRLAHFYDDESFERIVNTPTRGIGHSTMQILRSYARDNNISLWQSSLYLLEHKLLASRALSALGSFIQLMQELSDASQTLALSEYIEHVIQHSGLIPYYEKEKGEHGLSRIENLAELLNVVADFKVDQIDIEDLDPLSAFLAHVTLESGETQEKSDNCVQMMTLHAAKGLEFDRVYLVGMEEGLFPHQRSVDDPHKLEEERRLCYVGITRARKQLTLSYAQHRRMYGNDYYPQPSRFIREIPDDFLSYFRLGGDQPIHHHNTAMLSGDADYALGQRVHHDKFGEGVILNLEGSGSHARVQINFNCVGTKWLVIGYAKLTVI